MINASNVLACSVYRIETQKNLAAVISNCEDHASRERSLRVKGSF
jgi:hypothetical protein